MAILNSTGSGGASVSVPIVRGQRYQFHFRALNQLVAGNLSLEQGNSELLAENPTYPYLAVYPEGGAWDGEPISGWNLAEAGQAEGCFTFIATGTELIVDLTTATADKNLFYDVVPVLR